MYSVYFTTTRMEAIIYHLHRRGELKCCPVSSTLGESGLELRSHM